MSDPISFSFAGDHSTLFFSGRRLAPNLPGIAGRRHNVRSSRTNIIAKLPLGLIFQLMEPVVNGECYLFRFLSLKGIAALPSSLAPSKTPVLRALWLPHQRVLLRVH